MSKKIKVLLDTSPLSNSNQVRGVGTYTRFLAQELEEIESLELERSTRKTSEGFNPDVVHFPFFDLFFPTLPLVKKAKTIVTIHDVIPLLFPEHYPVGIRGKISWKRQSTALKNVKMIITDSNSSKNDIVSKLKIPEEKIEVVYLAGNPEISFVNNSLVEKTKKLLRLPKEYLLYVGDINYNKNLIQLIKAMKYLPERVNLVLLGKNFKEQEIPEWQWITSQISLSDVADRVQFINNITVGDHQTISAIYTGAICYVQPSLYEGFGLPILEAMQANVPVVCSNNSSLIEVGGKHAVFTDSDAESLAEGIKDVISWPDEKRNEIVKQALKWAESFTWQKVAQETAKIYHKVAEL